MKYEAHETAIIDKGAEIGSRSKIWHWVHVCREPRLVLMYRLAKMFLLGIKLLLEIIVKFKTMFLYMIMCIWMRVYFVGRAWYLQMFIIHDH